WLAPRLLARRGWSVCLVVLLAIGILVPLPTPGWPPSGWVVAACDVGQGDALVLRASEEQAVVVDVGPDPVAVAGCLDRLGVKAVPLLVLTHFHAGHVDGLEGVFRGRQVGAVEVSPVADPPESAAWVREQLAAHGLSGQVSTHGQARQVGDVR